MDNGAVEVTEADGRRALVWAPADVAPALRELSALVDEVAALRGWPFARAAMRALLDAAHAGILDGDITDAAGAAWLWQRTHAILESGS